jgi:hypothetical protein
MKKLTLLEAVIFCALTITVLNSCDNDLVTYKTSYSYEVKMDYSASVCYQDEATSAINAFNIAIGTDGYSYKAYETNQDNKMKSACESVKERFSNVNSTYMKFDLYRLTLSADPQTPKKEEIIGTYVMGQALTKPFVTYSISTNEDQAYAGLNEMKAQLDEVDEKIYIASRKTLRTLLGRHQSSSTTGGTVTSVSYSAFEKQGKDEICKASGRFPYSGLFDCVLDELLLWRRDFSLHFGYDLAVRIGSVYAAVFVSYKSLRKQHGSDCFISRNNLCCDRDIRLYVSESASAGKRKPCKISSRCFRVDQ